MNRKIPEEFEEKGATKESLRGEIVGKRNNLSREEVEGKSKLIKENLLSLPEFQSAHTVAFYASLKKNNEVDTEELIKESLKMGKRVLVPVTDLVENKIVFSELKNFEYLAPGTFDILEPIPELRRILPYHAIRLIVVPGIVFDLHGHRIGYGLGFYDKVLSELTRYVAKIGLAFELQVVEKMPNETHDAKLNKIITEERVIECS